VSVGEHHGGLGGEGCSSGLVLIGEPARGSGVEVQRAQVLIGGRRRPIAGTVTMDQLLVDCGDDPVAVGDEVVLLGRQGDERVGAEEWARLLGTISYEIVCGISTRVPRRYQEDRP